MSYQQYLASDHWKSQRIAALKRADFRCQVCNRGNTTLDVHHRTYERIGQEIPADLTVLCRRCHEVHHKLDEIIESERNEVWQLANTHDCFEYRGAGTCRRCGVRATYDFGGKGSPRLACDISCDILMHYEENELQFIGECPFSPCENCHALATHKFRYSIWGYEDAAEEYLVCGDTCRDFLVAKLDAGVLSSEHKLDAGQFKGEALSSLHAWYLEAVLATIPPNGSKIRRACLFESNQRANLKTSASQ